MAKPMRFYRVHVMSQRENSQGYSYFTSLAKAAAFKRVTDTPIESESENGETWRDVDCVIEPIDVEPTKAGILGALNCYGGHPDNG